MTNDQPLLSRRAKGVNSFRVMDVLRRARELEAQGSDVIHMEVGEPDFSTAAPMVEAATVALRRGLTQYTSAVGLTELRVAIAEWYAQRHGVVVAPRQILVTPGASGGLALLANLLIDPGDGVLLADPSYPCNRNFIHLVDGRPQLIPVTAETRYQPTPSLLDQYADAGTRGLWLAAPGNPTGTVLTLAELTSLSDWARARNCHLLVDEIYHGLHYTAHLSSVLEVTASAFVVNSFSKYFGMTGWRVGWLVVPEAYVERAEVLAQNLFIAAPTVSQYGALAAFSPAAVAICEERRSHFQQRRDFLVTALRDLGFSIPVVPDGAFYLYAGIDGLADDCEGFCRTLLEQQGVAITPGTDFGTYQAERHVRIAFTTSLARLEEGVERIARALRHR